MVDDGYLEALIDLDDLDGYWQHMLKDYPEHPASESPSTAMPITIYGALFGMKFDLVCCSWGLRFFCINHHKLNPLSKSLECNSGDEGQALGGNYMLFHWQCDLAPFLSDSGASRYLITTIPSYAYVFDGAVNITLQAAAQHICNSLAGLKISIPTMDLAPEP